MDSDSDTLLSSLASMDYLRREIAKFERLIAERTARVLPAATSPKAAGRRPLLRVSSAANPSSPVATVPSTSPDRGGGASALRADSRVRLSERPKVIAHFQKPRGSDRGREDEQSTGGHAEERTFWRSSPVERDARRRVLSSGSITVTSAYEPFWPDLRTMRNILIETRLISCFSCGPAWPKRLVRSYGMQGNSRPRAKSSPCSRLGSAVRIRPNGIGPN